MPRVSRIITQRLWTNFVEILEWKTGCVTNNSWLDFGSQCYLRVILVRQFPASGTSPVVTFVRFTPPPTPRSRFIISRRVTARCCWHVQMYRSIISVLLTAVFCASVVSALKCYTGTTESKAETDCLAIDAASCSKIVTRGLCAHYVLLCTRPAPNRRGIKRWRCVTSVCRVHRA